MSHKGRFVAIEVDVERLTLEMLSIAEQITLFRDQDALWQHLFDSRANQITPLHCKLVDVCARPLVFASTLVTEAQKYDQLRQSADRFCLDDEQRRRQHGSFKQQTEALGYSSKRAFAALKFRQFTSLRRLASLLENCCRAGTLESDN